MGSYLGVPSDYNPVRIDTSGQVGGVAGALDSRTRWGPYVLNWFLMYLGRRPESEAVWAAWCESVDAFGLGWTERTIKGSAEALAYKATGVAAPPPPPPPLLTPEQVVAVQRAIQPAPEVIYDNQTGSTHTYTEPAPQLPPPASREPVLPHDPPTTTTATAQEEAMDEDIHQIVIRVFQQRLARNPTQEELVYWSDYGRTYGGAFGLQRVEAVVDGGLAGTDEAKMRIAAGLAAAQANPAAVAAGSATLTGVTPSGTINPDVTLTNSGLGLTIVMGVLLGLFARSQKWI